MENASKALIIAGSVLIAILIISLGLFIFKSTEGTTDQTKKLGETLEVQQFNSQFLKYCGDSVKGSQVRTLCEVIIAHNANSSANSSTKVGINSEENTTATAISQYRNGISTNKSYKVDPTIDEKTGLIKYISVSENQ